jgi:hypothetical protein
MRGEEARRNLDLRQHRKPVPQVQRPGMGGQASSGDADIATARARLKSAPSGSRQGVLAAVDLIQAKRAAAQPRNSNGRWV